MEASKPKPRIVRYAIVELTRENTPYSPSPSVRTINGVYTREIVVLRIREI